MVGVLISCILFLIDKRIGAYKHILIAIFIVILPSDADISLKKLFASNEYKRVSTYRYKIFKYFFYTILSNKKINKYKFPGLLLKLYKKLV